MEDIPQSEIDIDQSITQQLLFTAERHDLDVSLDLSLDLMDTYSIDNDGEDLQQQIQKLEQEVLQLEQDISQLREELGTYGNEEDKDSEIDQAILCLIKSEEKAHQNSEIQCKKQTKMMYFQVRLAEVITGIKLTKLNEKVVISTESCILKAYSYEGISNGTEFFVSLREQTSISKTGITNIMKTEICDIKMNATTHEDYKETLTRCNSALLCFHSITRHSILNADKFDIIQGIKERFPASNIQWNTLLHNDIRIRSNGTGLHFIFHWYMQLERFGLWEEKLIVELETSHYKDEVEFLNRCIRKFMMKTNCKTVFEKIVFEILQQ